MRIIPPCVVCGVDLQYAFGGEHPRSNQPHNGTAFTSHGHYGSTLFDPTPADDRFLEINFCDRCLAKTATDGRVVKTAPQRRPPQEFVSVYWTPEDEDGVQS